MQRQRFAAHFRFLLSKETAHPYPECTQKRITRYCVALVVIYLFYISVIVEGLDCSFAKIQQVLKISDLRAPVSKFTLNSCRLYVTYVFLSFAAKHTGKCSQTSARSPYQRWVRWVYLRYKEISCKYTCFSYTANTTILCLF